MGISAFIIDTAVVAMFAPVVLGWCRRRGASPSRLLIPVSYLAILGGTCTPIGTSTNIILIGLLRDEQAKEKQRIAEGQGNYKPESRNQLRGTSPLEIGKVGLPCAMIGVVYLLLVGRRR